MTLETKSGRLRQNLFLSVSPDVFRSCSYANLQGAGVIAGLRRSVWKDKPARWQLAKAKLGLGQLGWPDVTASVAKNGTVKFSGKMPDGRKVSCSATAFVDENEGIHAYLIIPAKQSTSGLLLDVLISEAEGLR